MKVFISGSISRKLLSDSEKALLVQFVERKSVILIGDAYGVDRAVQQWLVERGYSDVFVYFTGEKPRNNVGKWQTRNIPNPENLTGRSRYQLKDKAMAYECDNAVMFWDGKSKGTKDNMDYIDTLNKKYRVMSEKKIFYHVTGTFLRNVADETNPVVIDEVFEDDNPITAREKAFACYQNYIDGFLESRGKRYVAHIETIRELQDFLNSRKPPLYTNFGMKMKTDWGIGAEIYLVESPETYTTAEGRTIYLNKKLIHYIDKQMKVEYKDDIFSNLVYEYGLYRQNGWDCKNHIAVCRKVEYLKTPIDFNKSRKKKFEKRSHPPHTI